jgi:RNA polymerase primary sigma factor
MTRKAKPTPRYPHRPATAPAARPKTGRADPDASQPDAEADEDLELTPEPEEGLPAVEELNGLGIEEPLELNRAELAAELSEDPVRLYLREIGQVKLLDAASEFRLATMIEGRRVILLTMRRHRMGKQNPTC